jgi:hypothetical protein
MFLQLNIVRKSGHGRCSPPAPDSQRMASEQIRAPPVIANETLPHSYDDVALLVHSDSITTEMLSLP